MTLVMVIVPCAFKSQFLIVGDGSEMDRLRSLADDEVLASRVHFLGHRTDVYDLLRALDLFVLCSDHEGLPTVLLEALFLGAEVVARRVGGIPEVIEHGHNGILVETDKPADLAEACLDCLKDPARSQRLASAGSARVAETFSATRTADEIANLYQSLVEAS